MERFVSIREARAARGLRMACLRGVPSPWTYTPTDAEILGAVSPELAALQRRIYETHLELPVPL